MKKLLMPVVIGATILLAACSNEPAPAAATQPAQPVQKEVIVVKPEPVVVKKETPEKETVVSLDKNGVKVQTKKVKVVLGKDSQ